mmetsp:Transcript_50834/g.110858  ORF Transcript_50834/g.110858 Transcript_50834/m.110858 type:complete len:113 (-) Transcript_50834:107-445(-)
MAGSSLASRKAGQIEGFDGAGTMPSAAVFSSNLHPELSCLFQGHLANPQPASQEAPLCFSMGPPDLARWSKEVVHVIWPADCSFGQLACGANRTIEQKMARWGKQTLYGSRG